MILAAIPIIVTPLYAFYRVKKFRKGILVILAILAFNIVLLIPGDNWLYPVIQYSLVVEVLTEYKTTQEFLREEEMLVQSFLKTDWFESAEVFTVYYNPIKITYVVVTLLEYILIPLYFARKWTIEYNERIGTTVT